MSGNGSATNGKPPDPRAAVMEAIKDGGEPQATSLDGDVAAEPAGTDQDRPPYGIPRHPEDPPGALKAVAREVCDPEQIRANAAGLGVALQAVSTDTFESHVPAMYSGIADVRKGAITGPSTVAIGEQLKISRSTDKDAARLRVDRGADGVKADRLEATNVPRAELKVQEAAMNEAAARDGLDAANERVTELRAEGDPQPDRRAGLMERVALAPRYAAILALIDMLIGAIVLEPPISQLVVTTIPYGSFLIAAGVSITLILGSAAAGFAIAAMRLPGRVVGGLMCLIFALVMIKLVVGLDLLRAGAEGGTQTLTAATLMACFVAALTGCAASVHRDYVVERESLIGDGTPVGNALASVAAAGAAFEGAAAERRQAETDRDALWDEIERLRDSAARADAAALGRERQGIEADVEAESLRKIESVHVGQEVAANEVWAVSIARLAREKTRAEELPESAESDALEFASNGVPARESEGGMSLVQKAAIFCLALGTVLGVAFGAVPDVIGAGLAVLLLLLSGGIRRLRSVRASAGAAVPPELRPIEPTATDDNPWYLRQPVDTVAKYRDGGAGTGQRQ